MWQICGVYLHIHNIQVICYDLSRGTLFHSCFWGCNILFQKNTVVTQKTPPIRKRPYGISKRLRWSKNPSQASFHDSKKRRKWWGTSKLGKALKGGEILIGHPIPSWSKKAGPRSVPDFKKRWEVSDPSWVAISLLLRWVGFTSLDSLVINLRKWQWLVGGFSPTKHWKIRAGPSNWIISLRVGVKTKN